MHIQQDFICKFCQSVFCCAQCRHKHEIKNHAIVVRKSIMTTRNITATTTSITTSAAITRQNVPPNTGNNEKQAAYETIYLFCPICANQPLPLEPGIYTEMLVHIETHHLPLRCEKCSKMYYSIDDLKEFAKCMKPTQLCQSQSATSSISCYTDDASKVTVTQAAPHIPISPMCRQDFNESHMTPISVINMRWKAKNSKAPHEEFISDSVSSIKNLSSISNSSIHRSVGVISGSKGKVIRSTSTPVHLEMVFAKPKEQTFNGTSGGQMSSIYNSGCESDISPALPQRSSQALETVSRYRKVGGARPKMTAVTPLRQVMSKSIQKAFAEHGLPTAATATRDPAPFQRKKMFETTSSPSLDTASAGGAAIAHRSPGTPALDLRLSPAVRRSQSESEESLQLQISGDEGRKLRNELPNMRRNMLLSAQKLTTESIVITRTEQLSSVSSLTSAVSSDASSINSIKPHTSANSSYQSATSNTSGGSVFQSCSSVKIITSTTEQIQQIQSVESLSSISKQPLAPLTPITRIPGATIHKKLIKFETPKLECSDSREYHNSPGDIFFTPNSTPMSKNSQDPDSDENPDDIDNRKLLVKQNLNGRFSSLRKPSLLESHHSTAFSRMENLTTNTSDDNYAAHFDDDEVFAAEEPQKPVRKREAQNISLWSLMSSVIGISTSRKSSVAKSSTKNESSVLVDSNSNSIIKRCASIAGSLVRSKPLVEENELSSLKRKRTFTVNEQSTSAYLARLNHSEATSPTSDRFNASSKRFRIQGRKPIDRMRLNS